MYLDLATQVFKQTSIFTVSSAAENNESLLHHGRPADDAVHEEGVNELGPSEEDDLWDSDAGFWSDEDDDIRMDSKGRRARDRYALAWQHTLPCHRHSTDHGNTCT